jgi:hypothetical protein
MFFLDSDWTKPENRRQFFDDFAALREFDPLVPSNWYSIGYHDIMKAVR